MVQVPKMDLAKNTMSCLPVKHGDDVIELVPKRLPPDHPIAKLPEAAGKDNLICSPPGKGSILKLMNETENFCV